MKKTLLQVLFFASLLLVGCKGKDGDPGPTGDTGDTGTAGAKGDTGATGVGFDNSTKDGNIAVTFSGKRPDNVAFNVTQDFKFRLDGGSPDDDSYYEKDPDTGTLYFYVTRYFGAVDEHHNNNYVQIQFEVSSAGVVQLDGLYVTTAVIDGTKYFNVNESDASVITLSNYNYDPATGKLKFNFSGTFAQSSSTGYDLTVSGVASVNVYQPLVIN